MTQHLDDPALVDYPDLLAQDHGIVDQTSCARWHKHMGRQYGASDPGGERSDNRVGTDCIGAVDLQDDCRANTSLFAPEHRIQVAKDDIPLRNDYHRISPRDSLSS